MNQETNLKQVNAKLKELKISEGTQFEAKDSLGKSLTYSYNGYGDLTNICFSIHLKNLVDGSDTYVEPAWFDNREITIIR